MSPPTFDVTPGHVHVTVPQHALLDPDTVAWISALGAANLTDEQHIALALMRNTGSVSNEMLRAWGVESHAATAALRGLVHHGLALKTGGRRYATYELADVDDEPGLFAGLDDAAPPPSPSSGSRPADGARQDSSLEAVVQAIRAGDVTTKAIAARLRISYWTATRRINTLLEAGRIDQTAPPHSRMRTFVVREGADPTS